MLSTPEAPTGPVTRGRPSATATTNEPNRERKNTGTMSLTDPETGQTLGTYPFMVGGGGRGGIPFGDYTVSNFRSAERRQSEGLGYLGNTFDLSDKFDPQYNDNRTALRIHAAEFGSAGCIGIIGGDKVYQDFQKNMLIIMQKGGGTAVLRLGSPDAQAVMKKMDPVTPNKEEKPLPPDAVKQIEQQKSQTGTQAGGFGGGNIQGQAGFTDRTIEALTSVLPDSARDTTRKIIDKLRGGPKSDPTTIEPLNLSIIPTDTPSVTASLPGAAALKWLQQKNPYKFREGAEQKITDEQWDTMSSSEQQQAWKKFLEQEYSDVIKDRYGDAEAQKVGTMTPTERMVDAWKKLFSGEEGGKETEKEEEPTKSWTGTQAGGYGGGNVQGPVEDTTPKTPFTITSKGGFMAPDPSNMPPTVMGFPAGQRAASQILAGLNEPANAWQKKKISPQVIQHLESAAAGQSNLNLNFVIKETGPHMTQKQISDLRASEFGQYFNLNVPSGWTPPTGPPKEQPSTPTPTTTPPQQTPDARPVEPPKPPQKADVEIGDVKIAGEPETTQEGELPSKPSDKPVGPPQEGGTITTKPGPDATPVETQPEKKDITPPADAPKGESTPAPAAAPPTRTESKSPSKEQPSAGPATADPEREGSQPNSGSYGGVKKSVNSSSSLCLI